MIKKRYFFLSLLFGYIIFDFILSYSFRHPLFHSLISRHLFAALLLFLSCALPILISVLLHDAVILLPIALLALWPAQDSYLPIIFPIFLVIATQATFFKIIHSRDNALELGKIAKEKTILSIIIIIYFSIFVYLSIIKFNALQAFNPKDFGLFNQTFWNTIHGRFFLNSTYGSHFACHNSPFFLLLVPFYYLFPQPLTLPVLKIIFLSLSAIPFYLIARDTLKSSCALPITVSFLLYPLITGQNFTPAHESGFAPFFILFTYYFFKKNKFALFMCFLLLTVSLKETYALVAVIFGCYAFFKKKGAKWILWPILIGIIWFAISILLINYFQGLYQPNKDSAWYFVYLKNIILQNTKTPLEAAGYLFLKSNFAHWSALKSMFLLFLPVAVIPPLFSSAILLGLPELMVNLLSSNPNMFSGNWHYSIVFACFILISSAEGIIKISSFVYRKNWLGLNERKLHWLICILILSCTLILSYKWVEFARFEHDSTYPKIIHEALSHVAEGASISVPLRVVPLISGREKYSINKDSPEEDYVLTDRTMEIGSGYKIIFQRKPIVLYKKITTEG